MREKTRTRWKVILGSVVAAATWATGGAVIAQAAQCGDTAGPFLSRVACACGDEVVTNTRLRPTDPIVANPCNTDLALRLAADHITLNCRNLAIETTGGGLTGIGALQRTGVVVTQCRVVGFEANGIVLDQVSHSAVRWSHSDGAPKGILVIGDDNLVLGSSARNADNFGVLTQGSRNTLWGNAANSTAIAIWLTGEHGTAAWNVGNDSNNGVAVSGNGHAVFGNRAARNQFNGLLIDGSGHHIWGNRAEDNGLGAPSNPTVGAGIRVFLPGNTLSLNVANDNFGQGICAEAGNIDGGLNFASGNGVVPEIDFDC